MRYIIKARPKGAFMNDLNTINGFLNEMCEFISHQEFDLCTDSDDGRVNSSIDEDIVLDMLVKKYAEYIYKMPPRSWCDFKHIPTGEPINFKSTSMQSSDNSCNYLSILHCFSDLDIPDSRKANKTKDKKEWFQWLRENHQKLSDENFDNYRDYWFLVVNKNDNSKVLYSSIKQLNVLSVNPSNPPFQVNWSQNTNIVVRTFREAFDFVSKTIKETIQKQHENLQYDEAMEIL
jgi:hypothetical protein